MGLDNQVNLLVAALDLNLVRLVRGAMNGGSPSAIGMVRPQPRFESRLVAEPTPRFEPRHVVHPTPRFEPRPVIHPASRVEPQAPAPVDPGAYVSNRPSVGPLDPPWKSLPCVTPSAPPPIVKLALYQVDIQNKGSLLDLFM